MNEKLVEVAQRDLKHGFNLIIKEVYNSIFFKNNEGVFISICERDCGFEITLINKEPSFNKTVYINKDGFHF